MEYRSVKGFTGLGQLGILMAFLGAGLILTAGLQFIIGMQLIPSNLPADKMGDAMIKALMQPENITAARLAQVLGTFCLLFLPAIFYLLVCHGKNICVLTNTVFVQLQQYKLDRPEGLLHLKRNVFENPLEACVVQL